ncbi:unnamed protein product [Caenorhabditis brenneri]
MAGKNSEIGIVVGAAVVVGSAAVYGVVKGGSYIWRKITRKGESKEKGRPVTDEDIRKRKKEVWEESIRIAERDEKRAQIAHEELMKGKKMDHKAEHVPDKNTSESDTASSSDDENKTGKPRQRRNKKKTSLN